MVCIKDDGAEYRKAWFIDLANNILGDYFLILVGSVPFILLFFVTLIFFLIE